MSLNINVTTQVSPEAAVFYDRTLLERGLPYEVHTLFAETKSLKQRNGKTINFRRFGSLPVATTALTEGVTPTGKTVTKTEITATIHEYGDFIRYSDMVDLVSIDPVLAEFQELLGEQSGETMDVLARDVYVAGTNVYYAGSYATAAIDTRVEVNTAPTASDYKKIREIMIGNKAKLITKTITASNGQGTMPVGRSFFCIQSHELQNDLEDMAGWLSVENYPTGMGTYEFEIGALTGANMRYLITQNGKVFPDLGGGTVTGYRTTSGSAVDVYASLVFGQKAVAKVPLDGTSLRSIVKDIGSGGASDPLDQRGSTGWKAFQTWCILNDLWLCRGEFACTL